MNNSGMCTFEIQSLIPDIGIDYEIPGDAVNYSENSKDSLKSAMEEEGSGLAIAGIGGVKSVVYIGIPSRSVMPAHGAVVEPVDKVPTNFNVVRLLTQNSLNQWMKFDGHSWWAWDWDLRRWDCTGRALSRLLTGLAEDLAVIQRLNNKNQLVQVHLDYVRALESVPFRKNLKEAASVDSGFLQESWEQSPYLVPVANGVFDVAQATFRLQMPEDYIKVVAPTPFDPDACAPRFEKFMEEILPDPELRLYVQRLLGSGLVRSASDQLFHFWLGSGANGKGVLQRAVSHVLGDVAGTVSSGLFVANSDRGATRFALSRQENCRILFASEVPNGKALEVALLKQLTGEDSVVVEEKFERQRSVRFVATLVMLTNEIPTINDQTGGTRRRVRVIPFEQRFEPGTAPGLEDELRSEASGILNWLLEGAMSWYEDGLGSPKTIEAATTDATRSFFSSQEFMAEVLEQSPGSRVYYHDVAHQYAGWARQRGLRENPGARVLGGAIAAHMGSSMVKREDAVGVCYEGWRLKVGNALAPASINPTSQLQ